MNKHTRKQNQKKKRQELKTSSVTQTLGLSDTDFKINVITMSKEIGDIVERTGIYKKAK